MQDTKIRRDEQSQAVLNTDLEGLEAYKKRRKVQEELAGLKADINTIKADMTDMKELLLQILNRG